MGIVGEIVPEQARRLASKLYAASELQMLLWLGDAARRWGSPIEAQMFLALVWEAVSEKATPIMGRTTLCAASNENGFVVIEPQKEIGPYRADFLVWGAHPEVGTGPRVVVECDGHDFHERTKEQARHDKQRDRTMQRDGLTVFRFTGSEIYSDPEVCAREVITHVLVRPPTGGQ